MRVTKAGPITAWSVFYAASAPQVRAISLPLERCIPAVQLAMRELPL